MAAPAESVDGLFDAIVAADNVLDVFDHADRLSVLGELRKLLAPRGLLIFSSHNLAHADEDAGAAAPVPAAAPRLLSKLMHVPMGRAVDAVARMPRRARNRRRLVPLQTRGADYAILNDSEADYGVLHHYIRRDDQERQLQEFGFDLVECLDVEGRPVAKGDTGRGPWLHYIARARLRMTPGRGK